MGKYADKQVSIKSEVVENFEFKNKTKNELATNTPGPVLFILTCMQAELLSARAISSLHRGALESNLTGRCPFFKNLHYPFRKKCISIPCFGIIRLQKFQKQ